MVSALPLSFYQRPTLVVARELIGKTLARKENGIISRYPITEVEAYDGPMIGQAMRGEVRLPAMRQCSNREEDGIFISSTECIGC